MISNIKTYGVHNSIMITHSNLEAFENNKRIRNTLFPNQSTVQPGDILMIIKNCLVTGFRNGDQAVVLETSKREQRANLTFLTAKVKDIVTGNIFETKIIESLLHDSSPNLNSNANRFVIIDFDKRMKEG